eukprot:jgi/Bigna1/90685/estExt_fgenesh1_pg.C_760085
MKRRRPSEEREGGRQTLPNFKTDTPGASTQLMKGQSSKSSKSEVKEGANVSSSTTSSDPPCAICLEEHSKDLCMLEKCLHTFHLSCIVEWWRVGGSCPLCKRKSGFALFRIRSKRDYEKVWLDPELSYQNSWWTPDHQLRRLVYVRNLRSVLHVDGGSDAEDDIKDQGKGDGKRNFNDAVAKRKKRRLKNRRHDNVLKSNARSQEALLKAWATRELQSILEVEDVSIIVQVVISLVLQYSLYSEQFKIHLREFTFTHTGKFVAELRTFLQNPSTIAAFDRRNVYPGLPHIDTIQLRRPMESSNVEKSHTHPLNGDNNDSGSGEGHDIESQLPAVEQDVLSEPPTPPSSPDANTMD